MEQCFIVKGHPGLLSGRTVLGPRKLSVLFHLQRSAQSEEQAVGIEGDSITELMHDI